MKKFKLSLAALALIAMASAFTVKETAVFADYWVDGDPVDGQYTIIEGPVSSCLANNLNEVCRISSTATPSGDQITSTGASVLGRRP